jgi:hypothetical protein
MLTAVPFVIDPSQPVLGPDSKSEKKRTGVEDEFAFTFGRWDGKKTPLTIPRQNVITTLYRIHFNMFTSGKSPTQFGTLIAYL